MNVYVFMGTHLPEMQTCVASLAAFVPEETPSIIYYPKGLKWTETSGSQTIREVYDPESNQWIFDPDSKANAFIVLDPAQPIIPQLEKLADDLRKCLIEPVKVVTCVDCQRAESSPQLRAWLDAGIYYSDVVLLGNRAKASKSFIRNFRKGYEKQFYPCLFLFLKGPGKPDQPLEILTPDARRLSQLFDLPEEEKAVSGLVIESSFDLDMEEPEIDPFRMPDTESGQGAANIPDVSEWIVRERE